jgi:phage gpG-like protein
MRPPLQVTIEVTGVDQVGSRLDRLARALRPAGRREANRLVGKELIGWVGRNFQSEGREYDSAGWMPLAPSTIAKRAARIEGKGKRAYIRRLYRRGKSRGEVMALARKAYPGPKDTYLGRFPILQDTGQLRESFHDFYDADVAGVGARSYVDKKRSGKRRAPTDLAAIHELGSGHVPARHMLPSRDQARDMAIRVYDWYIAREITG